MSTCACSTSIEASKSVYFSTNIAFLPGTPIPAIDISPDGTNIYKTITVINDTDQDIKITYSTVGGYNGEFIVPKSIKGFTKTLKSDLFVSSSFIAISLGIAVGIGKTSFNFSS